MVDSVHFSIAIDAVLSNCSVQVISWMHDLAHKGKVFLTIPGNLIGLKIAGGRFYFDSHSHFDASRLASSTATFHSRF